MNFTDKNVFKINITLILVLFLGFSIFYRFRSEPKNKFTPEQKAVLAELNRARTDLHNARLELEQTKQEMNDLIVSFKGVAVAKGFDPNVGVTWLPMNGNPINCGDKPALWGFRADGTVTWKRP